MALFVTTIARAAVEFRYFRAEFLNDVVVLDWATDFEVDLNGFFVTRSDAQNGTYTHISNLFPSEGDAEIGANYAFTDEFISSDTTYWYRLEAVDNNNQVTYSESVRVVTGTVPTPTATNTTSALVSTPESNPTATGVFSTGPTLPARTSTPTAPLLPGAVTATVPGRVTLTPMDTATLEATETLSATATLVPLPEITLQFPTPVANLDISSEGSDTKQEDHTEQQRKNILRAIERALFIGFIALIWIVLAVWFYVSSRRVE